MISKDTRWVIAEAIVIIVAFILVNMFLDFYKIWYYDILMCINGW